MVWKTYKMHHFDSAKRGRDEIREPAVQILGTPAEVSSKSLLGGQREITILHEGDRYRLRITANEKLILTK